MPINTDLNISPYFDDFDENKNFHRVLFKPHLAVQARELTQLQTILQNQIERFGDNILREGTIVTGGNFVEESQLSFVRLQDNDKDGNAFDVTLYDGLIAEGKVSGLRASIQKSEFGLETQFPDLNTFWVKYLNTTIDGVGNDRKTFENGEDIVIYDTDGVTVLVTAVAAVSDAVGFGYGVRCGDGVIFQKGAFVGFTESLVIVSKYDTTPDDVLVGFQTVEEIITSFQDESLLDNANSFNNYNAPGADRLKLTPTLSVMTKTEAVADESFFAIQEYRSGNLIRRKLDTVYSKIGDMVARRTSEESGDYVVHGLDVSVESSQTDPQNIALVVDPGVGYVNGYRVSLDGAYKFDVSQGTDFVTEVNQNVLLNYGNYIVVNNMSGWFDFEQIETVDLESTPGTVIGTARVRSVTNHESGTFRIYVFDVKMNAGANFADARSIVNGADGSADIVLDSNGNAIITDANFKKLVFPLSDSHLKGFDVALTEYVYRTKQDLTSAAGGQIDVTVGGADEFPYGVTTLSADQIEDLIVVDTTTGNVVPVVSAQTVSTKSLVVQTALPAGTLCKVYYNAMRTNASPIGKVPTTFTVTIDTATHPAGANGPWSLGMPDAYALTSVAVNGANVTSKFFLESGQRDAFYGLSKVSNKGSALTAGDTIVITAQAYTKSTTGTFQQSFFSVDSYSYNSVSMEDISVYRTENGEDIDLRDAIDFRPYVDLAPEFGGGVAATNPSATETFPATTLFMGAPNSYVSATYDYYVGRYDRIIVDQNGQIGSVTGTPSENPVKPTLPTGVMLLGDFYIAPFPSLPSSVANKIGKPAYGVKFSRKDNRRYTMADIRDIDRRVENIEYYTALSLLEQETKDLVVLDANNLNRFKNGIFVDSFKDFRLADMKSDEFKVGIDLTEQAIQPSFKAFPVNLKVKSLTNATNYGETVTLVKQDIETINQPYATAQKSCTTSLYGYTGSMLMFPDSDASPDVFTAPDINIDIDLATPFAEFTEALSEFVPLQRSSTSTRRTTTRTANQTVTTNTRTTTTTSLATSSRDETREVGDFVTDFQVSPWLRAREVKVLITGLRPGARFWPYFDGVDVSAHCAPAVYNSIAPTPTVSSSLVKEAASIVQNGPIGEEIRANAAGELYFIFNIPAETFRVGDRKLEVFDVSSYGSADAMTSYASKTYSGFSFSLTKAGLTTTTRVPEIGVSRSSSSSSTRTVVNNAPQNPPQRFDFMDRGGEDPLFQSFIVDADASDESSTTLTAVDLFFSRKSATNGVTVMLREMRDGQPTATTVPFSKVHLNASEIATSTDASSATRVTFDSPVAIKTNVEYGICIMPDANDPDFLVWISRTGEQDVQSNVVVTHDTNSGMIFTSTNNRTWTPYQNENLKFTLYAAEFEVGAGSVTFEPNNMEFLSLDVTSGEFTAGEQVFVDKAGALNAGTISLNKGNSTILGNGTTFQADLVSGDWLVGYSSAGPQLVHVTENGVVSDTEIHLIELPTTTETNVGWGKTVVGRVSIFTQRDGAQLILEDSSAKVGNIFQVGDTIVGAQSGAVAVVTSVDEQKISFIQPNIRRIDFVGTTSQLKAEVSNGAAKETYLSPYNNNTYLRSSEGVVASKSLTVNGTPDTTFTIDLATTNVSASPVIDFGASSVLCYGYQINNDATGETTTEGSARAKYVSKVNGLAEGMDAEDMKVYLTGYRPEGTEIEVYAKLISSSDARQSSQVGWTKMEIKPETNFRSSVGDRFDYREFEFGLPTTASGNVDEASYDGATFTYVDADGVIHSNYKSFAYKVVLLSNTHNNVPRVADIRGIALV